MQWYNDHDYILNRLPVAQGNSYVQIFYAIQFNLRCRNVSGLEQTALSRIIT